MTLSVVTPTCDRPVGLALAARWIARQTRVPDEWIVADGGWVPAVCPDAIVLHDASVPAGARNFLANLARGVAAATGDVIAIMEDDDFYQPTHLATICAQLTPGMLAAGDDWQHYYHVRDRVWRIFHNRGASLCQTAFTRAAVPAFQAALGRCASTSTYGVDGAFWSALPRTAMALARTQTVIGIKGLPGRGGLGIGHRPAAGWQRDPTLRQLRAWIGADADVYAPFGARAA